MVPEVEVAPLGAGVEINDLVEMVGTLTQKEGGGERDKQSLHFFKSIPS